MGRPVPDVYKAYLEILDAEIEAWRSYAPSPRDVFVVLYLSGWSMKKITEHEVFNSAKYSPSMIRQILIGTREYDGLINTMTQRFIEQAVDYCPFCQRDRFGDGSIHPKLSGTICPHREIWEEQEAREAAK